MTFCYIFDIDGTIADLTHRLSHIQTKPANWNAFFEACGDDEPIQHICDLARTLIMETPVIYVSGRSDQVREKTEEWLMKNNLWTGHLYMRTEGDHRPDNQVKLDLLKRLRDDGFKPIMAFDDRDQVVNMWRSAGIPCAQVAEGNF